MMTLTNLALKSLTIEERKKPTRNFDTLKKHEKNSSEKFLGSFSKMSAWLLHCSFESKTQSIFNQDLEKLDFKKF